MKRLNHNKKNNKQRLNKRSKENTFQKEIIKKSHITTIEKKNPTTKTRIKRLNRKPNNQQLMPNRPKNRLLKNKKLLKNKPKNNKPKNLLKQNPNQKKKMMDGLSLAKRRQEKEND